MPLQSATPAVLAFARYFARPDCPRCGETQFAPEHSEFVRDAVVQHLWSCEVCANSFQTKVEFEPELA